MRNKNGKVIYKTGNVVNEEEVKEMMRVCYKELGSLNILINNAGIMMGDDDRPDNTPLEVYKSTMDVNVLGPYLCMKHAIPYM
jgi:meso-butanediol dehydrogenase/(S,S)-butanediol dehydrogenase/diacetyl reductase